MKRYQAFVAMQLVQGDSKAELRRNLIAAYQEADQDVLKRLRAYPGEDDPNYDPYPYWLRERWEEQHPY